MGRADRRPMRAIPSAVLHSTLRRARAMSRSIVRLPLNERSRADRRGITRFADRCFKDEAALAVPCSVCGRGKVSARVERVELLMGC